VWARILRVLTITQEVRSGVPPTALGAGGSRSKRWSRPFCPLIPNELQLSKDLDLSDELILDSGHCVSR